MVKLYAPVLKRLENTPLNTDILPSNQDFSYILGIFNKLSISKPSIYRSKVDIPYCFYLRQMNHRSDLKIYYKKYPTSQLYPLFNDQ